MTIRERLEPGLEQARSTGPDGLMELTALENFQLSQAISLRRIADALDDIAGRRPVPTA